MKASYYQQKKWGAQPNATRGVVTEYVKLLKPNDDYASIIDEHDVEVRSYGQKNFRVYLNGEDVGGKAFHHENEAMNAFRDIVDRKKTQGWKVMNERSNAAQSNAN